MKTVRAIHSYAQRNEYELNLTRGVLYQVIQVSPNSSWMYGYLVKDRKKRSGWFPTGYVEDCCPFRRNVQSNDDLGSDEEMIPFPVGCVFKEKGFGQACMRVHLVKAEIKKAKKISAFIYRKNVNIQEAEFLCKTKRLKNSCSPIWDEEYRILSYDSEMEAIEIILSSEKKSKVRSKPFAKCQISLRSCLRDFNAPGMKCRWITLLDENNIKAGSLLVNLQYINSTSISSPVSLHTTLERLKTGKIPRSWSVLSGSVLPCASESSISASIAEITVKSESNNMRTKIKIVTKVSERALTVTRSFKAVISSSPTKSFLSINSFKNPPG
eukprot:TRINITY_DN7965_c0_g1_i1.p1 TRINITY_DN7965_c0_g1~~TRINITY_DN7965_c0_g1_i1.p1  ORF type:complete len:326 (+),score=39.72 TRINITY_DN7965_c0_g1_i1:54-1031(+)